MRQFLENIVNKFLYEVTSSIVRGVKPGRFGADSMRAFPNVSASKDQSENSFRDQPDDQPYEPDLRSPKQVKDDEKEGYDYDRHFAQMDAEGYDYPMLNAWRKANPDKVISPRRAPPKWGNETPAQYKEFTERFKLNPSGVHFRG